MSYAIDAAANSIPVFGVDLVLYTASGGPALAVIVQDISGLEIEGEKVVAKNGIGDDVARVYFNRDLNKVFSMNCWPVGVDEAAAAAVDVLFKQGRLLQIFSSTRYPTLVGFWRVRQCTQTGSNTDKKMVSLSLEWSIKQDWAGYVP